MNTLAGQVVVITGASSGIGEASARLFGAQGCRVVLAARRLERLDLLAQAIRSQGGTALPVQMDMSRRDDLQRLVERVMTEFGQVDILVNNAGFGRLRWLEELDLEADIRSMVETNLLGTILLTRLLLPGMLARKQGHIINLASIAGLVGTPTYSVYAATKFGMRGFTEALRREVRLQGIHVSGIYPGAVDTEFISHVGGVRKTGMTTPAWLMLSAEQVAQTVVKVAKRPRRMVLMPWPMVLAIWANALFPGVIDWAVQEIFVRSERGGG
jgi:short-subunit dehydrogenase